MTKLLDILKKKSTWDFCETWGAWFATVASSIAAMLPLDKKQPPILVALVFAVVVALSKTLSKRIEREEARKRDRELQGIRDKHKRMLREALEDVLDDFRRTYFAKEAALEKYNHRVTLFVCDEREGDTGKTKRLAIFARCGLHRDSKRTWQVDDNDIEKCRGIAGRIWFHDVWITKTAACDWPLDAANQADKARYAESLGMTVAEAESLNVKSKVFTGLVIPVRGRKWGVLVLDSLKEGHISDSKRKKESLSQFATLIGSILDRMEL